MPTAKKAVTINELSEQLDRSHLTIIADYRGLKVSDLQGLRRTLRPFDAEVRIAKNTLTRIAADNIGIDGLEPLLEGPTSLVMAYGDVVGTAKAVGDFVRTSRILAVRGGVLDKRLVNPADIEQLATMPSVEVLRGRLVGMLASPMTRVVGVLGGPSRSIAYLLNARAEELGGGEVAEAVAAD